MDTYSLQRRLLRFDSLALLGYLAARGNVLAQREIARARQEQENQQTVRIVRQA